MLGWEGGGSKMLLITVRVEFNLHFVNARKMNNTIIFIIKAQDLDPVFVWQKGKHGLAIILRELSNIHP